jgi:hypothetical protein
MESGEKVHLKSIRKVVVIGWDTTAVTGKVVSIQVHGQEKRTVDNDGESNIFFPDGYSGSVEITVEGSHGGSEHGTITIP